MLKRAFKISIYCTQKFPYHLRFPNCGYSRVIVGEVEYERIEGIDPDILFKFNKKHGSSELNFIPDDSVFEHLSKLDDGKAIVWGAFVAEKLVGFISCESCSNYFSMDIGEDKAAFIHEFVVDPDYRGLGIGTGLTTASVCNEIGIFSVGEDVKEIYTTCHAENDPSRGAFLNSGYEEVVTFEDLERDRQTTVLKFEQREDTIRVVGCQSGNAVDGIDVGIFDFTLSSGNIDCFDPLSLCGNVEYETLANRTFPFTDAERNFILKLRTLDVSGEEYARGNYELGELCAKNILSLVEESCVSLNSIDVIGSHGQTICGHPHWEFGDLSVIAQRTGITTAGDFRPSDVAQGGNGTPCTCTYDTVFLAPPPQDDEYIAGRIAINIGGTSSVTFLPPARDLREGKAVPIGLDPGIGVFFMDLAAKKIDPEVDFDEGGQWARAGRVNSELMEEMMKHPYYQQSELPIGVGPEDFSEEVFEEWWSLGCEMGVSPQDFLSTVTEQSTFQVALACQRFGGLVWEDNDDNRNPFSDIDVVLRGNVCLNQHWVDRLQYHMEELVGIETKIKELESLGIDGNSWENAMYALFGMLCVLNIPNFIPSCTGADVAVVGGKIAPAGNYGNLIRKLLSVMGESVGEE